MRGSLDQFRGCLLGLALGDALCAPYEGGVLERLVWRLIGRTRQGLRRYTDDTQMAMNLAEHLLEAGRVQPDALAQQFAESYRWSRGYGPGAAQLLRRVRRGQDWRTASTARFPEGSFANGAAMRVAPLALFHADCAEGLDGEVDRSASVTHPNPLARQGARHVARAVWLVLDGMEATSVLEELQERNVVGEYAGPLGVLAAMLEVGSPPAPQQVRARLGVGVAALESCPAALLAGLCFMDAPFAALLDFVRRCGGDTDTIAAMAGAIWGAARGAEALPGDMVELIEGHGRIAELAEALWQTRAAAAS